MMQASINHQPSVFPRSPRSCFFRAERHCRRTQRDRRRSYGTYRDAEGNSEIRILALGHGKLKVQLALVYEYQSGEGRMANLGDASGEATIENDVAVFVPKEAGDCKI